MLLDYSHLLPKCQRERGWQLGWNVGLDSYYAIWKGNKIRTEGFSDPTWAIEYISDYEQFPVEEWDSSEISTAFSQNKTPKLHEDDTWGQER